ncbi:MAG: DNA repair protein RecN, partial [Bacteroidales bacterium]|nr:DNA repair protein RecN [Candidatus Equibacterium intestinale]
LEREWKEICLRRQEAERNRDYNQFRWQRLDAASPEAGELERLEAEQATLANSELIKETLAGALAILSEGEQSMDSRLKSVGHSFGKITDCLPGSEELRQRIESCRIELKDISASLEDSFSTVDSAPDRLDAVESRIALIYDLMQKNGADSYDRLLEIRDAYKDELSATDDLSQQEAALAAEVAKADNECSRLCSRLSEAREAVLEKLSGSLQSAIRELEMPRARFEVKVERKAERTPTGADDVIFAFSSAGEPSLKDLTKCASGGEMSRIMLCVKSLLAEKAEMPTVIFDEIDTGISGALADKVGQKIVAMGEHAQVIAITHLPQVAVKGSAHFLVYKEYGEQSASSHIRKIEGEERVEEIARMISGSTITPEALAAARVLLDRAAPAPIMKNLF